MNRADADGNFNKDSTVNAREKAVELVRKMYLEEDDIEDVENDIIEAEKIWDSVVICPHKTIDMKAEVSISDNGPICKIMESLGATYSIDDHGKSLEIFSLEYGSTLDVNLFIDWYISYLYKTEEDEECMNDNDPDDLLNNVDSKGSNNSDHNWSKTTWTITPSKSVAGETWKCNSCYVINTIESDRCISCEAPVA